jgi:uncharacterized protein (DUF302 family)
MEARAPIGRLGTEPLMQRLISNLAGAIARGAVVWLCVTGTAAAATNGLVIVESAHDVPTTAERFVAAAESSGLTVFSRIDHAAGAKVAGLDLRPTELVIFGAPTVGTALMHCDRTVAIDLPLKALIWEDGSGTVLLGYNDSAWLAGRHDLADCGAVLDKVAGALEGLAAKATAPDASAD